MEELEFIIKIVKESYKKYILNQRKNVEFKESKSFLADVVTSCDKDVEKYITSQIKQKYPNDTIIGEEYNNLNEMKGRCWVIDPIDGTVNFSRDMALWCTQVAFIENGKTKCACIYIPTTNELYSADDKGAYLNGKKIKIDKEIELSKSIINMCDIYQDYEFANFQLDIISNLYNKVMKVKMFGSAGYEFAQVASSRIQAYVLITNNCWDILPGEFICKMSGAEIISSNYLNKKLVIACNSEQLHNEFINLINNKKV